jgi:hypothetical protein
MSITASDITSGISALAALIAAYHAVRANGKATTINANVNGRFAKFLEILGQAAITVPHEVAAKVVAAPPAEVPPDATPEEQLTLEWLAKIGKDVEEKL